MREHGQHPCAKQRTGPVTTAHGHRRTDVIIKLNKIRRDGFAYATTVPHKSQRARHGLVFACGGSRCGLRAARRHGERSNSEI